MASLTADIKVKVGNDQEMANQKEIPIRRLSLTSVAYPCDVKVGNAQEMENLERNSLL